MSTKQPAISIIIPANNEAGFIEACLRSLLNQDTTCQFAEVIVSANACSDDTVDKAKSLASLFEQRDWVLKVIDHPEPGKLNALNRAEAEASGATLAYLDADVLCDPALVGQLVGALSTDQPCYATGTFALQSAKSLVSRLYGRFWMELPFMKSTAVGAGLFAVNRAGRARWGAFPDIISDDTFVRLTFAPHERVQVPAHYHWPLVEGFAQLVRVRRRQNAGIAQLQSLHPEIFRNEDKVPLSIPRLALRHPLPFLVYASVQAMVRLKGTDINWSRGR